MTKIADVKNSIEVRILRIINTAKDEIFTASEIGDLLSGESYNAVRGKLIQLHEKGKVARVKKNGNACYYGSFKLIAKVNCGEEK